MSGSPARLFTLPTRAELRSASPWVWVLLVLAAVDLAVGIASAYLTPDFDGFLTLVSEILGPASLVIAAALIFVAPRERLVQLAAIGFALPVIVELIRLTIPHVAAMTSSHDWALLTQRLTEWTDALTSVLWASQLAALVALAVYLGSVRTRAGWIIVLASVVLAALHGAVLVSQWPPLQGADLPPDTFPLSDLVLRLLAQLVIVAWGYLLAITYERRMFLFATATAAQLLGSLIGLLTATVFFDWLQGGASAAVTVQLIFIAIPVVYLAAFVGGVLTELPRQGRRAGKVPTGTSTHEAPSAGR